MSRIGLLIFVAVACWGADPSVGKLSSAEKADGWRLLFDGETTEGWTGMRGSAFPAQSWTIEDGMLRTQPDGSGGDLRTVEEYTDFELALEWKLSAKGNSGIKYAVQEAWAGPGFRPDASPKEMARRRLSAVGPEYQLLDDSKLNGKPGWELSSAASLYLLYAPKDKSLQKPGEWNSTRIVVKGNHGEHWLNGVKVVEFEFGSREMMGLVEKTKFRRVPGFGRKGTGPIVLQHHGSPVWFRSIKVRKL